MMIEVKDADTKATYVMQPCIATICMYSIYSTMGVSWDAACLVEGFTVPVLRF